MLTESELKTLNKGANNVQEKSKKVSEIDLRHLVRKFEDLGTSFNYRLFEQSLDLFNNHPQKTILVESLFHIFSLLQFNSTDTILWHYLLQSGKGLRSFSLEYKEHIDRFVSFFGMPNIYSCVKNKNSRIQYKFGCLKELLKNESKDIYGYKASLALGLSPQFSLELGILDSEYFKLLPFFDHRMKLDEKYFSSIMKSMFQKSTDDLDTIVKEIQILNMLSLIYRDSVEFNEIRSLTLYKIKKIKNINLRSNLLGNYYYQDAQVKYEQRDYKEVLYLLNLALEYDSNYFDYYYKKGLTYEMLGDFDKAKANFTDAVIYSGFSFSTVNDLGCLLNDYFENEFLDFETLIDRLKIY